MPKSKKKKNSDFQKVKLKVGKKLKKADNVTNASFKSRTIQVTQKLKKDDHEPSTKRRLNIQELLTQCQHYNISVRHDALTGLRELLTSHHEVLFSNLGTVLERSASLFTDKDPVVRQAVVKLLKSILPQIPEKHFSSFFPIVSAHLCCCMTHIYDDIQTDSLELLDLLLEYYPKLIVSNSSQILPNFIEQISRTKSSSSQMTGTNRALTVNPNSKTSSQRWRTGVLKRLHKLLTAIINLQINENSHTKARNQKPSHVSERKVHSSLVQGSASQDKVSLWCEESAGMLSMSQSFQSRLTNKGFVLSSCHSDKKQLVKVNSEKWISLTEEAGMEKFVKVLIPLLLECWVEAGTSHSFNQSHVSGGLISQESLALRTSALLVIQLLWKCVSTHSPTQMALWKRIHLEDFRNHFLQNFPYSVHQSLHRNKRQKKAQDEEISARGLNLAICDIMTYFVENGEVMSWETIVTDYLKDILCNDHLEFKDTTTILEILNRLITRGHGEVRPLLRNILHRYKQTHALSAERRMLFRFFSDLITDQSSSISSEISEKFIETLPDLLMKAKSNPDIVTQIVMVMKTVICQRMTSPRVQRVISDFFLQTLDGSCIGTFEEMDMQCQRRFVELLYYLPPLQESSMLNIAKLCKNQAISQDVSLYTLQILHHRYLKSRKDADTTSQYISLLLTVLMGNDTSIYEENDPEDTWKCKDSEVCCHFDGELWEHSLQISKAVSRSFQQFLNTSQVVEVLCDFLSNYLSKEPILKGEQVMSMIILANEMEFWKYPISKDLTNRMVNALWCLLHVMVSKLREVQADFIHRIVEGCVHFVSHTPVAMDMLITLLVDEPKDDVDGVEKSCRTLSCLLRHQDVRSAMNKTGVDDLKAFIVNTEVQFPAITGDQWWADTKYLLSMAREFTVQ